MALDISLSGRSTEGGGGGGKLSILVSPFLIKYLGETGGGDTNCFSSSHAVALCSETVEFVRDKIFGKTGGGGGGRSGEGKMCFGKTAGGGLGRGSTGNTSSVG